MERPHGSLLGLTVSGLVLWWLGLACKFTSHGISYIKYPHNKRAIHHTLSNECRSVYIPRLLTPALRLPYDPHEEIFRETSQQACCARAYPLFWSADPIGHPCHALWHATVGDIQSDRIRLPTRQPLTEANQASVHRLGTV